jgi:hypothetical protein
MVVNIEILVKSKKPKSNGRSDLLPTLFALAKLLTGRKLKDENGKELPIDNVYPSGKWEQTSKESEPLSFRLPFKTMLNFPAYQEGDNEKIRELMLSYYKMPENVEVAEDKFTIKEECKDE